MKDNPDDEEARLSATYAAIELDRLPEAAELIEGLPENDPRGRVLRGRLLILQQQPRQAIAVLEPLLHGAPPALELDGRRYLAEGYLAVGESAAAIQMLQGRVGNDPSLALVLARAQYLAGNPADAAATLAPFAASLLARKPANASEQTFQADVAFEYGQALLALAKWPEAIAALETATAPPAEAPGLAVAGPRPARRRPPRRRQPVARERPAGCKPASRPTPSGSTSSSATQPIRPARNLKAAAALLTRARETRR